MRITVVGVVLIVAAAIVVVFVIGTLNDNQGDRNPSAGSIAAATDKRVKRDG